MQIGIDPRNLIITLVILLAFGVAYNALVARIGSRRHRGFTSLLVAVGVLVTLVGVAALNLNAAIITILAFVASGTPMILGSIVRYVRAREAEENRARQDALNALQLGEGGPACPPASPTATSGPRKSTGPCAPTKPRAPP